VWHTRFIHHHQHTSITVEEKDTLSTWGEYDSPLRYLIRETVLPITLGVTSGFPSHTYYSRLPYY
jgi:hypothetical protein